MKRYFKDLDADTKAKIILGINELDSQCRDMYYEERMFWQQEEGELMLGKDYKGVEIRDYYSSFYLVLTNWHNFLDNLDSDYLCDKGIELYNEIMLLKNEYENIVLDTIENEDRFNELEDIIEEKCKDLLKICEKQLLEYEDYKEEDYVDFLKEQFEINDLFSTYYIIDNDYTKVYEDVNYTRTFE